MMRFSSLPPSLPTRPVGPPEAPGEPTNTGLGIVSSNESSTHERIRGLAEAAQDATRRGANAEAVARYRELVALAPLAACLNNFGLALARDGQLPQALAAYRCALEATPSAATWINLGNVYRGIGDKVGAIAAYRAALVLDSNAAPAHYNMHAAMYDAAAPGPAMRSLERALALRPEHLNTRFYLGALRALHEGDLELVEALPAACAFLVCSLQFVSQHRRSHTQLFADTFDTLRFALSQAPARGSVIELGVRRGTSLRFLAGLSAPTMVHGFDAFEGLPDSWGEQECGLYSTGGDSPDVPKNVTLYRGWFVDTLPAFVATLQEPVRLLHVDCDVYSSTRDALACLGPHIAPGTVIVFDEYLCNPNWENDEHRALSEANIPHTFLAFSLFTKQAAVVVI